MEYPFKLSEIIAGCESGAWLEKAVFVSEKGLEILFHENKFYGLFLVDVDDKFNFLEYAMEVD